MSKDDDKDPKFGTSHDSNSVFSSSDINIIGLKDQQKREVLTEINKDGMISIDRLKVTGI